MSEERLEKYLPNSSLGEDVADGSVEVLISSNLGFRAAQTSSPSLT